MTDTTAVLGEERLREIEADHKNAALLGLCDDVLVRAVLPDIPSLLASHRALAQELRDWRLSACFGCGCMDEAKHTPAEFQRQWEEALARDTASRRRTEAAEARNSALEERVAALESVLEAARCIKHWHDAMPDDSGMVVSAAHVRALWQAIHDYDAAALSPQPSPQGACTVCNGRGEVGHFTGHRSDAPCWDASPCPECNGTGKEPPAAASPQGDGMAVDCTCPVVAEDGKGTLKVFRPGCPVCTPEVRAWAASATPSEGASDA